MAKTKSKTPKPRKAAASNAATEASVTELRKLVEKQGVAIGALADVIEDLPPLPEATDHKRRQAVAVCRELEG